MKKLLLSLFTFGVIGAAQAQLDLSVTAVTAPAPNTTVNSGTPFTSTFTVTNVGTTTVNTGDTIFYYAELNGNRIQLTSGVNVFSHIMTKNLATNDTVNINFTISINFGTTSGAFDWGFRVRGITCCPSIDDANTANDASSISLNAAGGTIGLADLVLNDVDTYFSNGMLHINTNNVQGDMTLEVYNLAGQRVLNRTIAGSTVVNEQVNLESLDGGVYIYSLKSQNKVLATKKFVKQ